MSKNDDHDITSQVEWVWAEDESIGLSKCACGLLCPAVVGIYRDTPWKCPGCGRKLYCRMTIKVMEVVE